MLTILKIGIYGGREVENGQMKPSLVGIGKWFELQGKKRNVMNSMMHAPILISINTFWFLFFS